MPVPVAARYKSYAFDRLVAGIAGSNPAGGLHVCLLCLCVVLSRASRGFCDEVIPRPEESYPVSNEIHKPKIWHRKTSIDVLTRKNLSLKL
jgi:hypothetical protein